MADRAANAVEIFSREGVLIAKVPVFAPTGVVALPNNQFAVSTLRSKRLVEIRDEEGKLVRSFGDPADAGITPDPSKLQNLGRVSGDGEGAIYFAFATLPDPLIRKFDRYGYAGGDARFDASRYAPKSKFVARMIAFSLDSITASRIFPTPTIPGRPSAIRATFSSAAGCLRVCSRVGEAEGRRPRNRRRTIFWPRDWPPAREVGDREESPAADGIRARIVSGRFAACASRRPFLQVEAQWQLFGNVLIQCGRRKRCESAIQWSRLIGRRSVRAA